MGDRRIQFNNWVSENDIIEFKKIIAKKYGIYLNNMQSHEVGLLIKWYNSVGGILPDASHTHIIQRKTKTKTQKSYTYALQ